MVGCVEFSSFRRFNAEALRAVEGPRPVLIDGWMESGGSVLASGVLFMPMF